MAEYSFTDISHGCVSECCGSTGITGDSLMPWYFSWSSECCRRRVLQTALSSHGSLARCETNTICLYVDILTLFRSARKCSHGWAECWARRRFTRHWASVTFECESKVWAIHIIVQGSDRWSLSQMCRFVQWVVGTGEYICNDSFQCVKAKPWLGHTISWFLLHWMAQQARVAFVFCFLPPFFFILVVKESKQALMSSWEESFSLT